MRLVRIRVPQARLDSVRETLSAHDVAFVVTPEVSDGSEAVIVEFPVPSEAVDDVLAALAAEGADESTYLSVSTVETARAPGLDDLEAQYVEGDAGEEGIAFEEIRTAAREMHPNTVTYYVMTLLSAVVATAGLLLNSPAVVVGAMVIAPQVGSALLTGVGTVLEDRYLLSVGVRGQVGGLALAIVGSALFGSLLQWTAFVPPVLDVTTVEQVTRRISPGLLSVVVAACAGTAGALALATALPVSLVGVMVAAALIPAAAAVGIGVAWGIPSVAVASALLLVMNATAINITGVLTLRAMGYYPSSGHLDGEREGDRRGLTAGRVVFAALLLVFAVGVVPMTAQVGFERQANTAVDDTLGTDRYADLQLVSVRPTSGTMVFGPERNTVQVVVSRTDGERYPRLSDRIEARLEATVEGPVAVTVVFRDTQASGNGTSRSLVAPVPPLHDPEVGVHESAQRDLRAIGRFDGGV